MLRSSLLRASKPASVLSHGSRAGPTCVYAGERQQRRAAHAISNPTLANIEKRWEAMPPQEQAELWMQLRDRMKNAWPEMTLQEKKAAYWIAFGPHGPRALPPPGETQKIVLYTLAGLGVALGLMWAARSVARPPPSTMNKEWQEATNEYLKAQRVEPISGLSSADYVGKGQVQSKPKAP
ncbi:MAG: Cytochrome c oxidase subunit 5A [Thelocarpon impressellum]|nr:MAG: Cytochrome c oxidase subunit 5A [Thelocarpon impressellum]